MSDRDEIVTPPGSGGAAQGTTWPQPIATAPKDGTEFIGYQNGEVYRCCWRIEEPDEGPGYSGWWDFSNESFEEPTEWAPLRFSAPIACHKALEEIVAEISPNQGGMLGAIRKHAMAALNEEVARPSQVTEGERAISEGDVIIVAARLRGLNALKDDYGQVQHEKVREALEASSLSSTERDEIKPHLYAPDYQAMGDCRVCGHSPDAAHHQASRGETEQQLREENLRTLLREARQYVAGADGVDTIAHSLIAEIDATLGS